MASIQSSPNPLAFPLADAAVLEAPAPAGGITLIRTLARALEGMQKECLTGGAAGEGAWRLVCDEGPYLNGTDLAPFPLAFFSTGLVTGYLTEILMRAKRQGIELRDIELAQDNFYTMEGSALRGDMVGGALPVGLEVTIDADAPAAALSDLVMGAVAGAPAGALLRDALGSEFAIVHNAEPVSTEGAVQAWADAPQVELSDAIFDAARPDPRVEFPSDIISKLGSEPPRTGDDGTGSSLRAEQKRTLHVRALARRRPDGLAETNIHLHKPTGSHFGFLCEVEDAPAGGARAPAALHYLSAGIAFCYLTQIGRYVTITRQPLRRYAIAQDTQFQHSGGGNGAPPAAEPVRTRVALESDLDHEAVRRIVRMGEQTCFLHAASRTALATEVRINIVA